MISGQLTSTPATVIDTTQAAMAIPGMLASRVERKEEDLTRLRDALSGLTDDLSKIKVEGQIRDQQSVLDLKDNIYQKMAKDYMDTDGNLTNAMRIKHAQMIDSLKMAASHAKQRQDDFNKAAEFRIKNIDKIKPGFDKALEEYMSHPLGTQATLDISPYVKQVTPDTFKSADRFAIYDTAPTGYKGKKLNSEKTKNKIHEWTGTPVGQQAVEDSGLTQEQFERQMFIQSQKGTEGIALKEGWIIDLRTGKPRKQNTNNSWSYNEGSIPVKDKEAFALTIEPEKSITNIDYNGNKWEVSKIARVPSLSQTADGQPVSEIESPLSADMTPDERNQMLRDGTYQYKPYVQLRRKKGGDTSFLLMGSDDLSTMNQGYEYITVPYDEVRNQFLGSDKWSQEQDEEIMSTSNESGITWD